MNDPLQNVFQKMATASARAAAKVARLGEIADVTGSQDLSDFVAKRLKGKKLILASNREPYAHLHRDGKIVCIRSAGGLTTALDSMAAACGAVWVCQGGANADFDVADEKGRVQVPPNRPSYWLHRLKLTAEEERGYYDGFSNETLWPLCHLCYVRPKFVAEDWKTYQAVNQKFASAIVKDAAPGDVVFLQDYHLALVAKFIKQARPDLTTVLFWHIPWPNPEIFRILPWKKEILDGILSNDIVGFHLGYHARNFMEIVGLEMECQIDQERMQVRRGNAVNRIRSYPISVDFKGIFEQAVDSQTRQAAQALCLEHGLTGLRVGLGVDRLDYTKGIPERLAALEILFEKHPEYVGRFTFVQIGVPSRIDIEDYQQVVSEIETRCQQLNERLSTPTWRPVIFLKGKQDFDTLIPFYQLADLCVVSSLHDGMNLVAKEFVAASSNDRGVLVLSQFTGAAREMDQALLVNPYDTHSLAEAMQQALEMSPEEQKARLGRLRQRVSESNVFTWAQAILKDVLQLAEDNAALGQ